jgi:hypothetical protein
MTLFMRSRSDAIIDRNAALAIMFNSTGMPVVIAEHSEKFPVAFVLGLAPVTW